MLQPHCDGLSGGLVTYPRIQDRFLEFFIGQQDVPILRSDNQVTCKMFMTTFTLTFFLKLQTKRNRRDSNPREPLRAPTI